MSAARLKPVRLRHNVLHLAERGVVTILPMTADFWSEMPAIFGDGRMLSLIDMERDWPNWEMHPQGDEVIWLVSGRVHFITEGHGSVDAAPGDCVVMPKGEWHTADVLEAGKAIFVTEGAGTQHRER